METTIEVVWHVGFGFCLIVSLLLAVFQLPGTWFVLLTTALYDWHFGWEPITWQLLMIMGLLALSAEVADLLAGP